MDKISQPTCTGIKNVYSMDKFVKRRRNLLPITVKSEIKSRLFIVDTTHVPRLNKFTATLMTYTDERVYLCELKGIHSACIVLLLLHTCTCNQAMTTSHDNDSRFESTAEPKLMDGL